MNVAYFYPQFYLTVIIIFVSANAFASERAEIFTDIAYFWSRHICIVYINSLNSPVSILVEEMTINSDKIPQSALKVT